jgi:hypothetical protein
MMEPHDLPNLIEQLGFGVGNQYGPFFRRCISHFEYPARICSKLLWTGKKAKNTGKP